MRKNHKVVNIRLGLYVCLQLHKLKYIILFFIINFFFDFFAYDQLAVNNKTVNSISCELVFSSTFLSIYFSLALAVSLIPLLSLLAFFLFGNKLLTNTISRLSKN